MPQESPIVPERITREDLKKKGIELSDCMLGSYWGTTAGLALGVFFALRKKSYRPFVAWVAVGSVAEYGYGYYNKCRVLREDFAASKRALDLLEKELKNNAEGSIDGVGK